MRRGRLERDRAKRLLQPHDRSLDRQVRRESQVVTPVEQTNLPFVEPEPERLSRVDRQRADAKAPRVSRVDRTDDLARESTVDSLSLAEDQDPVVRSSVDRTIELSTVL